MARMSRSGVMWIVLLLGVGTATAVDADIHGVGSGGVGCVGTVDCSATIEAGITAASAGDTVRVFAGTYTPLGSADLGNLHGRIGIGDTDSTFCPLLPTLGSVSIRIPADKSPLVIEGDPNGARPIIDLTGKPENIEDRAVFGVIAPDVTIRRLEIREAIVAVFAGCEDTDADCECGPGLCTGDGATPCRIDVDCSGPGGTCNFAGRPLGRADGLRIEDSVGVMKGDLVDPFAGPIGDVSFVVANAITLAAGFPGTFAVVNLSGIRVLDNTISVSPPACNAIRFRAGAHSGAEVGGNTITDYEDAIISNAFGGCGSICKNTNFDVHDNVITTPASDPGCFFEGAIYFKGTDDSTVRDNEIIDGGGDVQAAIQISGSAEIDPSDAITVTIDGNKVTGTGGIGSGVRLNRDFGSDNFDASTIVCNSLIGLTNGVLLSQAGETNDLTLEKNQIESNSTGVLLDGGDAVLNENLISGNTTGLDATLATNTPIDATSNWWGSATGPTPPGSGDPVVGSATVVPFLAAAPDVDGDGIHNDCDPCPNDPNDDGDGDGFCADLDNCPDDFNPGQEDLDNDGEGDLCDQDDAAGLSIKRVKVIVSTNSPGKDRWFATGELDVTPSPTFIDDVTTDGLTIVLSKQGGGGALVEVNSFAFTGAQCSEKNGSIKCKDEITKNQVRLKKRSAVEFFKLKVKVRKQVFTLPEIADTPLVVTLRTTGDIDRQDEIDNCTAKGAKRVDCKELP